MLWAYTQGPGRSIGGTPRVLEYLSSSMGSPLLCSWRPPLLLYSRQENAERHPRLRRQTATENAQDGQSHRSQ